MPVPLMNYVLLLVQQTTLVVGIRNEIDHAVVREISFEIQGMCARGTVITVCQTTSGIDGYIAVTVIQ